jgi:hypothetical protein
MSGQILNTFISFVDGLAFLLINKTIKTLVQFTPDERTTQIYLNGCSVKLSAFDQGIGLIVHIFNAIFMGLVKNSKLKLVFEMATEGY